MRNFWPALVSVSCDFELWFFFFLLFVHVQERRVRSILDPPVSPGSLINFSASRSGSEWIACANLASRCHAMPCKTDYRRATEKEGGWEREREREREWMDRSCVTVEDESGTLKSIKLPINLATDKAASFLTRLAASFFIRERTTRAPWLNGFQISLLFLPFLFSFSSRSVEMASLLETYARNAITRWWF